MIQHFIRLECLFDIMVSLEVMVRSKCSFLNAPKACQDRMFAPGTYRKRGGGREASFQRFFGVEKLKPTSGCHMPELFRISPFQKFPSVSKIGFSRGNYVSSLSPSGKNKHSVYYTYSFAFEHVHMKINAELIDTCHTRDWVTTQIFTKSMTVSSRAYLFEHCWYSLATGRKASNYSGFACN